MKRALRVVWVLAANGYIIWLTLARLSGELLSRDAQNIETFVEYVLELFFPVLGIILELVGLKFAKWINIGYLTLAGCFLLGEAIWWRSDPFFGVLLIMSVGLFILAGLTEIIYRRTKTHSKTGNAERLDCVVSLRLFQFRGDGWKLSVD